MEAKRWISIVLGGVAAVATFVCILSMLVFSGYLSENDRTILIFLALGPLAVVAVMVGYGVWWFLFFLLNLLASDADDRSQQ